MLKRIFDIVIAIVLLLILGWIILLFWIICIIDTKSNGLFFQKRVGQFGKIFTIIKLKTFKNEDDISSISKYGQFIRAKRIDELPQLINVLVGNMSMVGPRPDLHGYYDKLEGEERKTLLLKPGITCEASLKYANEDFLLSQKEFPLQFNDEIIFPDKVKMNLEYYYNQSILLDFKIMIKTVMHIFNKKTI